MEHHPLEASLEHPWPRSGDAQPLAEIGLVKKRGPGVLGMQAPLRRV